MGFLERWFGGTTSTATTRDSVLEQYRLLISGAPAEALEFAHTDAFTELDPPARDAIYERLSEGAGTGERPLSSEPATLARAAIRVESRRPGRLEDVLGASRDEVAGSVVTSPFVAPFLPFD